MWLDRVAFAAASLLARVDWPGLALFLTAAAGVVTAVGAMMLEFLKLYLKLKKRLNGSWNGKNGSG